MNTDRNEFEVLQRLLSLKRHEVPPPGYFNHFSDRVIARIEEANTVASSSWWQWLIERLEFRPFLACTYGFALCFGMLYGLGLAQFADPDGDLHRRPPSWLATAPSFIMEMNGASAPSVADDTWAIPGGSSLAPVISQSGNIPFSGRWAKLER